MADLDFALPLHPSRAAVFDANPLTPRNAATLSFLPCCGSAAAMMYIMCPGGAQPPPPPAAAVNQILH
eukprot:scaffold31716_cov161-Skeletonema_marinoi.AAC.1